LITKTADLGKGMPNAKHCYGSNEKHATTQSSRG
jgi:hypothetical protein